MRQVLQTKYGVPHGNCFTACVASILELPIDAVPEYQCDYSDEVWWERWQVWLWDQGYRVEYFREGTRPRPDGYAILGVGLAEGVSHAVVTFGDQVIWNPHHNVPLPGDAVWKDWTVITPRAKTQIEDTSE